MYLFVRGIDFASFYNFPIGFWICSNSVVFLVILKTNYSIHLYPVIYTCVMVYNFDGNQEVGVGIPLTSLTPPQCLRLSQTRTWIFNPIYIS